VNLQKQRVGTDTIYERYGVHLNWMYCLDCRSAVRASVLSLIRHWLRCR
jgi:hypothetical protein